MEGMNQFEVIVPAATELMEEAGEELAESQALLFIGISVGLVIMAGLMSGLTIGLMAMDEIEMEVRQYSVCRSRAATMSAGSQCLARVGQSFPMNAARSFQWAAL